MNNLDGEFEGDVRGWLRAKGKELEPNKDKRFVRGNKGFVKREVGVLRGISGKMALGEKGLMGSMKKLNGMAFTDKGVGKTEMKHQKKPDSKKHGELWLRVCNGLKTDAVLKNICDGKQFETRKKEFVKQKTKQVKNIKKELKKEEAVTDKKSSKKPDPKSSWAKGAKSLKLAEQVKSNQAVLKLGQVKSRHSNGSSHASGLNDTGAKWLESQPVNLF